MIHAYDKMYLDDAMRNLGEAFDYAVYSCGIKLENFMDMFITTGIASVFEKGLPKYISGLSGTELVIEVVNRAGKNIEVKDNIANYDCSPEYWCGWVLAYYQWYTGRSFKSIDKHVSVNAVLKLYPTLHEASEDKFVDTINVIIERSNPPTNLQFLRRALGYSQRILAEKSGVSLRMIQQYEQRAKDINKATGINLVALAQTLGCRVEDLIEYSTSEIE